MTSKTSKGGIVGDERLKSPWDREITEAEFAEIQRNAGMGGFVPPMSPKLMRAIDRHVLAKKKNASKKLKGVDIEE